MQFLIEYRDLKLVEPAYWEESLGVSEPGELGTGVVLIVNVSSILFLSFMVFHGVGGVGGGICDFSMNMGDRSQCS